MTDLIRYDLLVQEALKGVVRRVLTDAARDGLPGDHHFYVSFRTDRPGVKISGRLRERYPEDMTIVLQHQFDNLILHDHGFEVGLSFSGVAERLRIPFDALTGFFDPSVQFGLKFEAQEAAGAEAEAPVLESIPKLPARKLETVAESKPAKGGDAKAAKGGEPKPAKGGAPKPAKEGEPEPVEPGGGEVVSLDAFRKKS